MKKATTKEFIELLNNFKSKNNIDDKIFYYYATFKFYKSTLLNEFYDMSLVKTNSENNPIVIHYSKSDLLIKEDDSDKFTNPESSYYPKFTPIIKDENVDDLQKIMKILEESNGFKSFIEPSITILENSFNSSKIAQGVSSMKIIELFEGLKETLKSEDIKESSLNYYLSNLVEHLSTNLYIGNELSVYKLNHLFRIRTSDDAESMMNTYYENFDKCFDLFKIQQSLVIGRILNAETENQVLDNPLLNQFIEEVKEQHPEWFKSFDESLTHSMTDDNAIRLSRVPLNTSTADFDLIDPKSFMATAYPSYTDGYSHISNRFMEAELNFIHLYGDNVFFKAYYHNLHIETENELTYCKGVDSDLAFCIKDYDRKSFILPVLDYLEKNNIIIDLSKDSTLYHYIKREDLVNIVTSEYPNLILIDHDLGYKKIGAIIQSKSFEEALENYHKDKPTLIKPLKNKPSF